MLLKIFILIFFFAKSNASRLFHDAPFLNFTKFDVQFKNYFHPFSSESLDFLQYLSKQQEINTACRSSLQRWIKGIDSNELWALKLLESTGKTINGKLTGRHANFGAFDFCTEFVRNEEENIDFDGKYCFVSLQTRDSEVIKTLKGYKNYQLKLSDRSKHLVDFNIGSGHGVCMPSTCDINEITSAFNRKFESSGFTLLPPKRCTTISEPERITYFQIVSFSIFATFILLTILSSYLDNDFLSNFSFAQNYRIIYTNLKSTEENDELASLLHGLKGAMVLFSCCAHCFIPYIIFYLFPLASINEIFISSEKTFSFAVVLKVFYERSHLFADQLFFVGGFFAMYAWFTILKRKKNLSLSFVPFFVARYIKVAITVIPAILIYAILPLLGYGPSYSDLTNHFANNCKEGFHYIFLLIGYRQSVLDMCLIPAWYFNADFQIYILNYFLIFYLITKPTIGFLLSIGQMIIFSIVTLSQIHDKKLPTFFNLATDVKMYDMFDFESTYFNLHTHYNTYVMGVICAFLVQNKIRPKILSNKFARLLVWLLVSSLCLFAFFYPYYLTRTNSPPNQIITFLYPVFDKIFTALWLFWFFYSMLSGYSDFLKPIFNRKLWIPISRLSFSIIVGQFLYLGWTFPTLRVVHSINFVTLLKEWIACLIGSFAIGNFLFFFFEAPLISMLKKYFGLKDRQTKRLKLVTKDAKLDEINNNVQCEKVKSDQ